MKIQINKQNNMEYDFKKEKKVCIIEDDDDIREIYSVELLNEGFKVITAINGEEGINVITKNNPDIILLDLQMPVKDGFEVMKFLQNNEQLAKIPVVVLTNADDRDSIKKISKFETRFYVIKALTTPKKIVNLVREVLH
jgi:CheY-like chemotaxis protein